MSKTVNLFDEKTGLFLGQYDAQESPLEPGEYILPTHSTDIKLLKDKIGFVQVFNAGSWKYVADNRGVWFDGAGTEQNVENFDAVINSDWTREKKPPTPLTAAEQTAQAIEAVRLALQSSIDEKAKSLGFSEGNALMLYAGFTNAFQPLAQTFAQWEASVWVQADAYKAEVFAGNKPMLDGAAAVAMMPAYQTGA